MTINAQNSARSPAVQQWGKIDAKQQILLIHGWGMNSGVWDDIAENLACNYADYLITAVDLPGYGHSASYDLGELGGDYNAQSLAQSLIPLLHEKQTIVIAWSMGGLVAIELLNNQTSDSQNKEISQLILVSSTPRFVQTDDWKNAVEAKLFEEFSRSLVKDHKGTLRRFLALQALGSRSAREDIKHLEMQLVKRGKADHKALEWGLKILLEEDKRIQLSQITDIPISLISGKLDTLVKLRSQQQLAQQDNVAHYSIAAAGHAPFISHAEEFNTILSKII